MNTKPGEAILRRFGLLAKQPARRRILVLLLGADLTEALVSFLVAHEARSGTVEAAPDRVAALLESGAWRPLWELERGRRRAAEASSIPPERTAGLAACRVLADRKPVDQVAAELGIARSAVVAACVDYAQLRGIDEATLQQLLGLAPAPASRPIPRPTTRPQTIEPAKVQPAPRPTAEDLRAFWAANGRRAPAHAIEALTRTEQSK